MPRVARELGVGVTSLYWHLRSKEELLDALAEYATLAIDAALTDVAVASGSRWEDRLVAYWSAYRSLLRTRPVFADLTILRPRDSVGSATVVPVVARVIERHVELLRTAGFSEPAARLASAALAVFTHSSILNERLYLLAGRPSDATVDPSRDFALDWDAVPRLLAVTPYWTQSLASDADFAFGLRTIVDGVGPPPRMAPR